MENSFFIDMLAILDTFHDFGAFNSKNNEVLNIFQNYYNSYLLVKYKSKEAIEALIPKDIREIVIKILFQKKFSLVEEVKIRALIFNTLTEGKSIDFISIKDQIVKNIKFVFGLDDKVSNAFILSLRQPFYNMIRYHEKRKDILYHNKFQILLNEMCKILDKTPDIGTLKRLTMISTNVTYPMSYFDDMSNGFMNKNSVDYHILNKDKKGIDKATILSVSNYMKDLKTLKVNDTRFIAFSTYNKVIKVLDVDYYFDNTIHVKIAGNVFEILNNSKESVFSLVNDCLLLRDNKLTFTEFASKQKETLKMDNTLVSDLFAIPRERLIPAILGAKRFGDWIQANISKDYYFFVLSGDYYNILYSIQLGAPVLYKDRLFNITPPENLTLENILTFTKDEIFEKVKITDKHRISIKDINKKDYKVPLSRDYFTKYVNAKTHYFNLKYSSFR